jgi:hypothetical protein
MDDFDAQHFDNLMEQRGAIRVILFSDSTADWAVQAGDSASEVQVVDRVKDEDELLTHAAALKPDAILMVTNDDVPTPAFSRTARSLCREGLSDRVVIMARNPVSYVNLAIRVRAGALLSTNREHSGAGHVSRRVCSPRKSGTAYVHLHSNTTTPHPGNTGEVRDM